MRLRSFRAATVTEAMAAVRAALGPEALILQTTSRGGAVEVMAAAEAVPSLEEPSVCAPARPDWHGLLAWHGTPPRLRDRLCAAPAPAAAFRFAALAEDRPVLLAGPPGAGKTLTIAKLATAHVLRGETPLVVSTDTRRAGAAEELAAYTALLGLPLLVADTPPRLRRALAEAPDGPRLIDTAGVDAHAPSERDALAELAAAAGTAPTLVLPGGLNADEAADIAAVFVEIGAASLVATRLDIARRLGGLLAAADQGLAFTLAGIGPGASDGLAPLTPDLLTESLRNGEAHAASG